MDQKKKRKKKKLTFVNLKILGLRELIEAKTSAVT